MTEHVFFATPKRVADLATISLTDVATVRDNAQEKPR